MKEIVSARLKNARLAKGWTRAKLSERSDISARQIKRIEDGPVSPRLSTVEQLAKALSLDDGVLMGEAPMPSELRSSAIGNRIDGATLMRLRQSRGWTRKQLSEVAKVSSAQIQRIEREEVREVRHFTLQRLARALGVDRVRLTGVGRSTQISARISPHVRLAFDLVHRQYGIGTKDLIQLAPLLFVLAAERSLVARRSNLNRVRANLDCVRNSMTHFTTGEWDVGADADVATEQESISARDVLGHRFGEGKRRVGANGPFEHYLCSLAHELDSEDVMVEEEGGMTSTWGMGWYQVCQRMLHDLCGEDSLDANHFSLARQALVVGAVRISDIPEELMTEEATPRRVEWLEDQFELWCGDNYRELFEQMKSIGDRRDEMIRSEREADEAYSESFRPTIEEEEKLLKGYEEMVSIRDRQDELSRRQDKFEREIRSILVGQESGMPGPRPTDPPTEECHED